MVLLSSSDESINRGPGLITSGSEHSNYIILLAEAGTASPSLHTIGSLVYLYLFIFADYRTNPMHSTAVYIGRLINEAPYPLLKGISCTMDVNVG